MKETWQKNRPKRKEKTQHGNSEMSETGLEIETGRVEKGETDKTLANGSSTP